MIFSRFLPFSLLLHLSFYFPVNPRFAPFSPFFHFNMAFCSIFYVICSVSLSFFSPSPQFKKVFPTSPYFFFLSSSFHVNFAFFPSLIFLYYVSFPFFTPSCQILTFSSPRSLSHRRATNSPPRPPSDRPDQPLTSGGLILRLCRMRNDKGRRELFPFLPLSLSRAQPIHTVRILPFTKVWMLCSPFRSVFKGDTEDLSGWFP